MPHNLPMTISFFKIHAFLARLSCNIFWSSLQTLNQFIFKKKYEQKLKIYIVVIDS